jgi:Domain of unknown function (DUF4352)
VRRLLSLFAVLIVLLATSPGTALAQDPATPETGPATSAIIYGSDGQPEGEISVSSLVDPFEDYESTGSPQRGFHYVMAVVTVTATSNRPIEAVSYGFYVVDQEGFQYTTTYLFRDSASSEATPDFAGGTIAPGQSLSGALFFELLDNTSVGLILFQPSFDRLITAADVRDDAVAAEGDPVEITNSDGSPAGVITVDEKIEPLDGVTSSPERGFEFVGVAVTIANTGDQPLSIEPYSFYITDEEGFTYTSYGAFRDEASEAEMPSLAYGTMVEPGATITGLVSFQILAGTKIGLVYYAPGFDRHVRLAEYAAERAPGLSGVTPTFEVTPVATTPGCEGVLEWGQASLPSILTWGEAFFAISGVLDGQSVDAVAARDAADSLAGLAAAQEGVEAPEAAQASQEALLALFERSATAVEELATAIENEDDDGIQAATAALTAISESTDSGGEFDAVLTALGEQCPELDTIG